MTETPLFGAGIHSVEIDDLDKHFLAGFPDSETRGTLLNNLKAYINHLKSVGVHFEIWLDGSFTTSKINPNDVDMVILAPSADLNGLAPDKQETLYKLLQRDTIKQRLLCDVFFCVSDNQSQRSYWRGWFGFDRNEQPKGIVCIEVGL